MITVLSEKGGDIITEKKYGDFDLRIEFRAYEQGVNGGIKYYVLENEYIKCSSLGLEFQTAYSQTSKDSVKALGALYDILPAKEKSIHPAPLGEWNRYVLFLKTIRYNTGSTVTKYCNTNGMGKNLEMVF